MYILFISPYKYINAYLYLYKEKNHAVDMVIGFVNLAHVNFSYSYFVKCTS